MTRPVETLRAWQPAVPGVREVLHASFSTHAYPLHAHGDWSLLLIDAGEVAYSLDGRARRAPAGTVTVLPPGVPHDGRSALEGRGFRKRVAYLDAGWLDAALVGSSVDAPLLGRPGVAAAVRRLHAHLDQPGEELAAESDVVMLAERITGELASPQRPDPRDAPLALLLRELLDASLDAPEGGAEADAEVPSIDAAARRLGTSAGHLIRSFTKRYGMPPHRYLTGRRVDRARRLLLGGASAAEAATASGFYDQPHLTRHFRRVLGVTPVAFQRSAA